MTDSDLASRSGNRRSSRARKRPNFLDEYCWSDGETDLVSPDPPHLRQSAPEVDPSWEPTPDILSNVLASDGNQIEQPPSTSCEIRKSPQTLLVKNGKSADSTSSTTKALGEKPYPCQVCDYRAINSTRLAGHMRKHTGEKPYACDLCDYRAAQAIALKIHKRKHTDGIGDRPFACDECGFGTYSNAALKAHIRIHTGERPFACDECNYRAAELSTLQTHKRTHTGERPYPCEICDYRAADTSKLRSHVRTHTGEKPYTCEVCDYRAADISNIKRHMNKHSGEKPFACDQCDYRCTEFTLLKNHIAKHHSGVVEIRRSSTHSCDECGYCAPRPSVLLRHKLIHTGEKPFACEECNFRSANLYYLSRHIKKNHTGEKLTACEECDFRSTDPSQLRRHFKKHHTGSPRTGDEEIHRSPLTGSDPSDQPPIKTEDTSSFEFIEVMAEPCEPLEASGHTIKMDPDGLSANIEVDGSHPTAQMRARQPAKYVEGTLSPDHTMSLEVTAVKTEPYELKFQPIKADPDDLSGSIKLEDPYLT